MNGRQLPISSTHDSETITDIQYISKQGLLGFISCRDHHKSDAASMHTAYNKLPPTVRNVVDCSVAFRFRPKRRLASSDSHSSKYSNDVQFYVRLLEQANSNMVNKLPSLMAIKCRFCSESADSAERSHIPGCVSLFDMTLESVRVDDFKSALRARLRHLLNDCPHTKRELSPVQLQAKFGQPYYGDRPGLDSFAQCWIQHAVKIYFENASNGNEEEYEIEETTAFQSQQQPQQPPQEPTGRCTIVTPPTHQSQWPDQEIEQVRTVIDVQYLSPGIAGDDGATSLNRTLEESFRSLPPPLQLLFTKTSVCKFYERQANQPTDKEKYSEKAFNILNPMEQRRPDMAKEFLYSICLFCTCCNGNFQLVRMDDIEWGSLLLVSSIETQVRHTIRCPASKRFLGDNLSSVITYHFGRKTNERTDTFARLCLTSLQTEFFSGKSVPNHSQFNPSPLGFATVEATITYHMERMKKQEQEEQEEKLKKLKQLEAWQKLKQMQVKINAVSSSPKPAANPKLAIASKATSPKLATTPVRKSVPRPSPLNPSPLGCATIEATGTYPMERMKKTEQKEKSRKPKQLAASQKVKQMQVKKNAVSSSPKRAANPKLGIASKATSPKLATTPSAKTKRKLPLQRTQLPIEYRDLYRMALDDLEWTLVSPYESDDDSFATVGGLHNDRTNMTRSLPLPSPESDEDIWVPLQPDFLSQCPQGVPYIVESPAADESLKKSHKRPRLEQPPCESLTRGPVETLGRQFKPYDVVFPTNGCTVGMGQVINNLVGNRHFMRLVSQNRSKYVSLGTPQERTKLAQDLVQKIRHHYKGVFYEATTSKSFGSPIIKFCEKDRMSRDQAIAWTKYRFEKGFQDVLHPSLLSSSFVLPSSISGSRTKTCLKKDHAVLVKRSKLEQVEHAPMIGLLHGHICWNTRTLNIPERMKLSDVLRSDSATSDPGRDGPTDGKRKQQHEH
ncbi:hypothetical protein IV203_015742 [Nitzschia inconspicua]|uniref:DUF6824 domain-containing protein n=1 Tax=Nitzschia inconspicua TaxID=303405 RepID=A0A9K3LBW2_9STRA|nr:hypothetical protein IV203_015742 [Nitzschia inconspicua]